MGALPEERCELGAKPFTAICLDLLGPIVVKAMTNKRANMKVWPILLVCQATGAMHMEVMHNYGTNALLLQWSHFVSIRGTPTKVVSDQGKQLTSSRNAATLSAKESPEAWN